MVEFNKCLAQLNTFGLKVKVSCLFTFYSNDELIEFISTDVYNSYSERVILGGGSNVLFRGDFKGLILKSEISHITKINEDQNYIYLDVGSGLVWDVFVDYCVKNKYYGVENLSLIPGNVGATAVQNAGAYGTEAKDVIFKVIGFDLKNFCWRELSNSECLFNYRDSIFKTEDFRNKFIITSIVYKLSKKSKYKQRIEKLSGPRLFRHVCAILRFVRIFTKAIKISKNAGISLFDYRFLKNQLEDSGLLPLRLKRYIVIRTRMAKLPDPAKLGNVGSFFKNPIVSEQKVRSLKRKYPDIITFPFIDGFEKISVAWLIENVGYAGKVLGGAGTLKLLPLTIVNYGDATSKDIMTLSQEIESQVKHKFDINIEKEAVII